MYIYCIYLFYLPWSLVAGHLRSGDLALLVVPPVCCLPRSCYMCTLTVTKKGTSRVPCVVTSFPQQRAVKKSKEKTN